MEKKQFGGTRSNTKVIWKKSSKIGRIDLAIEVDVNRYQQRSRVQMIVRDVRPAQ